MKTTTLHVSGTHCASCKILIEDVLNELPGFKNIRVDLKNKTVTFDTDLVDSDMELAEALNRKMRSHGYSFSVNKTVKTQKNGNLIWQALPIGLTILVLFSAIQKSKLLNFGFGGTVTPATSFIIGLAASVSSCLAVVGGLVLSLSATVSLDKVSGFKPITLFHTGRLTGFALLGGLLGVLGGTANISPTSTAILGIAASAVMIMLGLNLVGLLEKNIITLPPNIFSFFRKIEHKTATPLLIGIGTFFLPCGFTQTMQVAALSSGSFTSGLMIMTGFALGTLPMLALLSFGPASFANSKHAPLFFKSAGIVVIGLGVSSLLAGLAGLGIINPLNFLII